MLLNTNDLSLNILETQLKYFWLGSGIQWKTELSETNQGDLQLLKQRFSKRFHLLGQACAFQGLETISRDLTFRKGDGRIPLACWTEAGGGMQSCYLKVRLKPHNSIGVWLLILYGTCLHTWGRNLLNLGRKYRLSFKNLTFGTLQENEFEINSGHVCLSKSQRIYYGTKSLSQTLRSNR